MTNYNQLIDLDLTIHASLQFAISAIPIHCRIACSMIIAIQSHDSHVIITNNTGKIYTNILTAVKVELRLEILKILRNITDSMHDRVNPKSSLNLTNPQIHGTCTDKMCPS